MVGLCIAHFIQHAPTKYIYFLVKVPFVSQKTVKLNLSTYLFLKTHILLDNWKLVEPVRKIHKWSKQVHAREYTHDEQKDN